jgi:hypothetical protein
MKNKEEVIGKSCIHLLLYNKDNGDEKDRLVYKSLLNAAPSDA